MRIKSKMTLPSLAFPLLVELVSPALPINDERRKGIKGR